MVLHTGVKSVVYSDDIFCSVLKLQTQLVVFSPTKYELTDLPPKKKALKIFHVFIKNSGSKASFICLIFKVLPPLMKIKLSLWF